MTRQDLINTVAKKVPYVRKSDIKLVIMEILNAFETSLQNGERVTLTGFGS